MVTIQAQCATDSRTRGGELHIEVIEPEYPLHAHRELWIKVQSDWVHDLATVLSKVPSADRPILNEFSLAPCAYYPDTPQSQDERKLGRFIDWWIFPARAEPKPSEA